MKIDLNNLYIVKLVMLEGYNKSYTQCYTSEFKNTVVYRSILGNFYDLSTRKRYRLDTEVVSYRDDIGKIFIDADSLIPLTSVLSFEEEKMSKAKILQKVKSSNI